MLDSISKTRLQTVHPALAYRIVQMDQILEAQGLTFRVAQALRTWEEQDALYAQGRTAPGKIVTNAPAGHSWHNFGLSADLYPNNPDGTIDWNPNHPDWKKMEQCAVSLALVSGANWVRLVDAPHVQLTGRFPVSPDDEVRELYERGGIHAVWDASGLNDNPLPTEQIISDDNLIGG